LVCNKLVGKKPWIWTRNRRISWLRRKRYQHSLMLSWP